MPTKTSSRDRAILALRESGLGPTAISARLVAQGERCSVSQVSRICAAHGQRLRPAPRADAGVRRKPLPADVVHAMTAIKMGLVAGVNAAREGGAIRPGKAAPTRIPSRLAIREAESRGIVAPGAVTASRLNRILRQDHGMGVTFRGRSPEARRTGPQVVRRFEASESGHRYQFDGTPLGAFYIDARGDIAYAPETLKKEERKHAGKTIASVLGFVDDHSRCVRFRAVAGETQRNVVAFAREVFTRSKDPHQPFCGLPSVIYADNGGGANGSIARAAWRALGVTLVTHVPGAPWGKGKVEAAFQRTLAYQDLTRGATFTSFEQANAFVRSLALELNNSPMPALGGRTPHAAFMESVARQGGVARGFAPDEDALWRRLAATRVDGLRVSTECTIALGDGEVVALPLRRPFVDWINLRVAVYIDTNAGGLVRRPERFTEDALVAEGGETMFVVDPVSQRAEFEIPRVRPEAYASVLTRPVEETGAQSLIAAARLAVRNGRLLGAMGEWIGANAPVFAIPNPSTAAAAGEAARGGGVSGGVSGGAVELIDRHAAKRALANAGWEITAALIDDLFGAPGVETIARARLDHLLDTGELPAAVEEAAA